MVIFAIPLMARSTARDWPKVMHHLSATIRSLQNQTSQSTHIIVAGTDLPDIDIPFSGNLEFISCPNLASDGSHGSKYRDGWSKRYAAARRVREMGGGFLMFVDADDLVSSRLAAFVEEDAHPNGYLVSDGYVFDATSGRIAAYPFPGHEAYPFDRICGTSIVLHVTPDELPRNEHDETRLTKLCRKNHAWTRHFAFDEGRPLAKIPFRAAVYLKGSENMSHDPMISWAQHQQRLVSELPAFAIERTPELEQEFGLSASEWRESAPPRSPLGSD